MTMMMMWMMTLVILITILVCFISGAAYLISSLSIDLSKYALEICKNTIGKLLRDPQMCKLKECYSP